VGKGHGVSLVGWWGGNGVRNAALACLGT
jgi:hypothetical protein